MSSPGATPALEDADILRLLPSSVQHVGFGPIPLKTAYLLDALSDSRCLPALKSLTLEQGIRPDGNDESLVPTPSM